MQKMTSAFIIIKKIHEDNRKVSFYYVSKNKNIVPKRPIDVKVWEKFL